MPDCIFCKIVAKEIPSEVIYEDGYATAFLDVNPIAPGHTLIVPKRHAATLRELDEDAVAPVFGAVRKVADMLSNALVPDGFSYGINEGAVTGQTVEHLHIHIAPRFSGDGGKSFHSIVHNPPKEDLKTIAEKIKGLARERKP